MKSKFNISGKVVVITGGAGLLGSMHAEAIAEIGGIPVLFDTNYINDSILKNDYNVFINLDDKVKTDYHNHEVIVELVSSNEEQKKIAREKYLYYKKNKLDAKHENL